jgi:hypothetical protein
MASDFGIKISKEGFDAFVEPGGSANLVFDTEAETLKLKSDVTSDGYGQYDTDRKLTFYSTTVGGFEPYLIYTSSSLTFLRRIRTPYFDGVV